MRRRLTRKAVAARYDTTPRTILRWESDPALGFPQPTHINTRAHYDEDELDEFDRRCAKRARDAAGKRAIPAQFADSHAAAAKISETTG